MATAAIMVPPQKPTRLGAGEEVVEGEVEAAVVRAVGAINALGAKRSRMWMCHNRVCRMILQEKIGGLAWRMGEIRGGSVSNQKSRPGVKARVLIQFMRPG
jgi:hypothetical protein